MALHALLQHVELRANFVRRTLSFPKNLGTKSCEGFFNEAVLLLG